MNIIYQFLFFIGGCVIGLVIFYAFIFPALYVLPKSIYMAWNGILKWKGVLVILLLLSLWTSILILIYKYLPFIPNLITEKKYIKIGCLLSLLLVIYRSLFTRNGKNKIKVQFLDTIMQFATPEFSQYLKSEREKK